MSRIACTGGFGRGRPGPSQLHDDPFRFPPSPPHRAALRLPRSRTWRCVRHARRYNPAHVVAGREAWMISTTVNAKSENIDADADMPLLWAIQIGRASCRERV